MTVKTIDKKNEDLKIFIGNLGESANTFTYFKSRSLDILDNHVTTVLGYHKNNPIAYGHLDKDGHTIWLGICIIDSEIGKGHGRKIMEFLIDTANKKMLDLRLSVKKSNIAAIRLYEKFNFNVVSQDDINIFMEKKYEN